MILAAKHYLSRGGIGALACVFAVLLTACDRNEAIWKFAGDTMGTQYHVTVVHPPAKLDRSELHWQFKNVLRQIDDRMTTWETSSELSRFNHAISNRWFSVSEMTAEVAELSLEISRQSAGSFDPTVASLVRLWKFNSPGFTEDALQPPSDEAIAEQLPMVGYHRLQVRRHPPALNKTAELELDFSAIAKGYGVDRVAEILEQHGITNYLVEVGGEIRLRGLNPQGQSWRVGVIHPTAGEGISHTLIIDRPAAVATSGNYRNFFEYDGKHYAHTLNPQTGWPLQNGVASVTVIHNSAARADALATAIQVMGPEAGLAFAEELSYAVLLLVRRAGTEEFETMISSTFSSWLKGGVVRDDTPADAPD